MSDQCVPDQSPAERRQEALCKLIKAAHHFLDRTKDRPDLLDIEEYWELGRATNEAASVNSK
jgi:hypothetical protein